MTSASMPRKLWRHPNPSDTCMARFMTAVNRKRDLKMKTFRDLYQWSIDSRADFWADLFEQHPLVHSGTYEHVVDTSIPMDQQPRWFEGIELNFAENILSVPEGIEGKQDHVVACVEVREGCTEKRNVTWGELRQRVGLLSNAMRAHGVVRGDRVAAVSSNSLDTLTVFMAVTSLGGIFTSSSIDMGAKAVLQRLQQVHPKWVFADDWALYNASRIDLRPKIREIVKGMEGAPNFQGVVCMPRFGKTSDVLGISKAMTLAEFLRASHQVRSIRYERLSFSDPFLIVYSSGTTGTPKCIVHSIGGVLINSLKEGRLHRNSGPDTVGLQFTTTAWIMYLSTVLSLHHGARVILYDGSPFQPDLKRFIQLVGEEKVTDFGISPRYLQTLASATPPIVPRDVTDLSHLRRVGSTGMVLSEALFHWFYDQGFPSHVQLCNFSGGTDLAAAFALDNPLEPVYAGGCQGPSLGLKVEAFDQSIEEGPGRPMPIGEPGELVCTLSFPNQPVCFWGDDSGKKYFEAYYQRFPAVWTQGDFIFIHPKTNGVHFLGRADGVLNPSGVRFGSAEIYSVIDAFFSDEVQDSICVGQRRAQDVDETVILFVLMKPGKKFTTALRKSIQQRIGRECSKRHVPKHVFETPEIPTTVNFKKVEMPVKRIVSGEKVTPSGTLLNPQSLDFYYQFAEIEKLKRPESKL